MALLTASACTAQPTPAAGAGGFYLAPRKLQSVDSLPTDQAVASPAISGVFLRIPWDKIQPERGRYDWTLFDRAVKQAVAHRKKLSIAVIAGGETPQWLAQDGVAFSQVTMLSSDERSQCYPVSYPQVWTDPYVNAYVRMMRATKDHLVQLGAYDSLEIVKISGMGQRTPEFRLPKNNRCSQDVDTQWSRDGYRPGKIVAAWGKLADGIAQAFPEKLLVQVVLQAQGLPAIDDDGKPTPVRSVDAGNRIINLCIQKFGRRCGVEWDGLNIGGQLSERVLQAGRQGATIGWQTNLYRGPREGSGCQPSRRQQDLPCSEADYQRILERGIAAGAAYIEVWQPDVLRFPNAFSTASRAWRR